MRQSVLLITTILFLLIGEVQAQNPHNEKMKRAIAQIALIDLTWNSGSSSYFPAGDYVTDSNGQITGQRFYRYGDKKYHLIDVTNFPENATVAGVKLTIRMNGDNIAYLSGKGRSGFEYNLVANDKGVVLSATNPEHRGERSLYEYMPDGRISQISYGNGKSVAYRKEFTYEGEKVTSMLLKYKKGRGPNPKALIGQTTSIYERNDDAYSVTSSFMGKTTYWYNAEEQVAHKIKENQGKIEDTVFTYQSDGKMSKSITLTTENGALIAKEIVIFAAQSDVPANRPYYEREEGRYKFDGTGDMVWESRNNKWRKKENGVWSDWQFFRM